MRDKLAMVAALLATFAGVGLLAAIPKMHVPPPPVTKPPVEKTLVCPGGLGETTAWGGADGGFSSAQLGGDITQSQPLKGSKLTTPLVLTGENDLVAGVQVRKGSASGWSDCLAPRTSGVLQVINPAATELLLINPDEVQAIADVTLWGEKGLIQTPGSRGIVLAPHTQRVVPISVLAGVATPVGIGVTTSAGRVAMVASSWTATSGDLAEPAAPALTQVLPGVAEGASAVQIVVTNPGTQRASVNVTAHGPTATYSPEGGQKLQVEPGSTRLIDLTSALQGERATLLADSDQPIVASVIATRGADHANATDVAPSRQLAAVVPAAGVLQVTNLADVEQTITVEAKSSGGGSVAPTRQDVRAGATWQLKLPTTDKESLRVTVTADKPVVAAVTTSAATGTTIAPLRAVGTDDEGGGEIRVDPELR